MSKRSGLLDTVDLVIQALQKQFADVLTGDESEQRLLHFAVQLGVLSSSHSGQIRVKNEPSSLEIRRGYQLPLTHYRKKGADELVMLPVGCHPLLGFDSPKEVVSAVYKLKDLGIFSITGNRYRFVHPTLLDDGVIDDPNLFPPMTWEEYESYSQAHYPKMWEIEDIDDRFVCYAMLWLLTNGRAFHFDGVGDTKKRKARTPLPILMDKPADAPEEDECQPPNYPEAFEDFMQYESGGQWQNYIVVYFTGKGLMRVKLEDELANRGRNIGYQCAVEPSEEYLSRARKILGLEEEVETSSEEPVVQLPQGQPLAKLSPTVLELMYQIIDLKVSGSFNALFPLLGINEDGSLKLEIGAEERTEERLQKVLEHLQQQHGALEGLPTLLLGFQFTLQVLIEQLDLEIKGMKSDEEVAEVAEKVKNFDAKQMQQLMSYLEENSKKK